MIKKLVGPFYRDTIDIIAKTPDSGVIRDFMQNVTNPHTYKRSPLQAAIDSNGQMYVSFAPSCTHPFSTGWYRIEEV